MTSDPNPRSAAIGHTREQLTAIGDKGNGFAARPTPRPDYNRRAIG